MNRRVAFPFLTLGDFALDGTPWSLSLDDGEWQIAGDFLPDWDCSSTIRIRREIRIDLPTASDVLGLDPDEIGLALSVRLGTGQGRLSRLIVHQERRDMRPANWHAVFDIEVAGNILSSVLDILTEVTLATRPSVQNPLSPSSVGDRLWLDRQRIRLEDEEPRFPIEVADIGTLLGTATAASAPWYLHWSPRDWSRDFHGAMRLYLNVEQTEFIKRIEEEDGPTLQALLADVMGQVTERFVTDPDAKEMMEESEPGSLGAQAAAWLRHAWPGKDTDFVRSVLQNRPGAFRAALLALAEPTEE